MRRQGQLADVLDQHSVSVAGDPPPAVPVPTGDVRAATVGGVRMALDGDAVVGDTSDLTLRVPDDLQPYLGAAGHVVVMRADGTRFASGALL